MSEDEDRRKMPAACDICGAQVKLKRSSCGSSDYRVEWLCRFCDCAFGNTGDRTTVTMATMFNELLKAIQENK